jgi:single-strand DNA-binding protein
MKGIQAAFTGTCGQDTELKTSKAGKPWASFSVAVDAEGEAEGTTWARVVVFGGLATELHPALRKGAEVYVEGRLRLEFWTGRDGRERTGLSVAASRVEVLGKVGFDSHQRTACPSGHPAGLQQPTEAQPELEGHGRTELDLPF